MHIFPILRLKKTAEKAILAGMPWVMDSDVTPSSEWQTAEAGSLATLETARGEFVAVGMLNPESKLLCRVLSLKQTPINHDFFANLFENALRKRNKLYDAPYYRLIHSEADGISGLVVDRFKDVCVAQVTSAGIERLAPIWQKALMEVVSAKTILFRGDVPARKYEGLPATIHHIGEAPEAIHEVLENGCVYLADIIHGQKTGWFYDMRNNRLRLASLAEGKTMLDCFSHSGGFGLLGAKMGAKHVTMVDSSALALDMAKQAYGRNNMKNPCEFIKSDAVKFMQAQAKAGAHYDIVIADPPPYIKSRKDTYAGMRGYEKLADAASKLVVENGLLFIASCSHHAPLHEFKKAILTGIKTAGKTAKIIAETGASPDHPIHPKLPQNAYLKGLILKINCEPHPTIL